MRVDLNSDVGESFGAYELGADPAVLRSITSANIACGYHAGDPQVMRRTVRLAIDRGVAIGAHPGFPDLVGFGRRDIRATPEEVEDMVLYQIGALSAIARSEGASLAHVKAHGALYNMAVRDRGLADAIARAVHAFDPSLVLFGLPGSELLNAARRLGLRAASEGFGDRAYLPDGSLAPRSMKDAVIHDPDTVVQRAMTMVTTEHVTAIDGSSVPLRVDTLCVHGDTPGAADLAKRLRAGLEAHGIQVAPVLRGNAA